MGSIRTQRGKFTFMKMPTSVHSLVVASFKLTHFHLIFKHSWMFFSRFKITLTNCMSMPHLISLLCVCLRNINNVQGAGKSLARPWKDTSYSDQDLQHYTKTYGVQTGIYSRCVVSLGRCSLSPSRVGLRTYQRPCICHECDRKWKVSQKHEVEKLVIHPNRPYLYQSVIRQNIKIFILMCCSGFYGNQCSDLWCGILEMDISVSKKNTASIFRVGKTVGLSSSATVRWNLKAESRPHHKARST